MWCRCDANECRQQRLFEQDFPWPLSIAGKDLATSDTIHKNLAYGGQIAMPFGPTFWAKGFGMLVDKFGVSWMVNCE